MRQRQALCCTGVCSAHRSLLFCKAVTGQDAAASSVRHDHLQSSCRSYVHFCACGKQLDSRLQELGAQRLADRVDVHKEDLPAIDKWLSGVTPALQALQLATFQESGGMHASFPSYVSDVILPIPYQHRAMGSQSSLQHVISSYLKNLCAETWQLANVKYICSSECIACGRALRGGASSKFTQHLTSQAMSSVSCIEHVIRQPFLGNNKHILHGVNPLSAASQA